jgi:DNA-binding response OmpR family regulator
VSAAAASEPASTSPPILVVDDDRKTADLIRLYLEREGFAVLIAHDGQAALDLARRHAPALVVLDLMLPHVDGLDVCYVLRAESSVPVIMLTARTAEEDKLAGLEVGADDYVTKPFSPRELVARVKAVLRRAGGDREAERPPPIVAGDLVVDLAAHEVRLRGQTVRLTPREFQLLALLAANPGYAFSRAQLLERAFGMDYEGLERTVDVHLMNLRRKIEPDPRRPIHLVTVPAVGYKFVPEGPPPHAPPRPPRPGRR